MLALVFDDLALRNNLVACKDRIGGNDHVDTWPRFSQSGLLWHIDCMEIPYTEHSVEDRPERYCYLSSTYNGPESWAGWEGNPCGFDSLFQYIDPRVLADMRSGRAMLLLDQLMEGFTDDRLYAFFHSELERQGLPPSCLVYFCGNYYEKQRYQLWCIAHQITQNQQIYVGSISHLELITRRQFLPQPQLSWEEHADHKQQGAFLYNCLNRVDRYHRNVMFMELFRADLLEQGMISCEKLGWAWKLHQTRYSRRQISRARAHLPRTIDFTDFRTNPAMDVTPLIYLNSYISVVTETLCTDEDNDLFVTEKPFKSIYALHPFMVLGQRGHLAQLRRWGYQTWGDYWDESYDEVQDQHDRARLIADNLARLRGKNCMPDIWASMQSKLEWNRQLYLSKTHNVGDMRYLLDHINSVLYDN
jgi:hypothetical protein